MIPVRTLIQNEQELQEKLGESVLLYSKRSTEDQDTISNEEMLNYLLENWHNYTLYFKEV